MTTLYGVLIELYPHLDEKPRWTISGPYNTKEEAEEYINQARRQNLPFKSKQVISFKKPKDPK